METLLSGIPISIPHYQGMVQRLKQLSQQFCRVVVLIGLGVLAGWIWQLPWLQSLVPGLPTMKPNAALGFVLAGLALGLETSPSVSDRGRPWRRRLSLGLALVCAGLGVISLVESSLWLDTGIGQWLFLGNPERFDPEIRGRLAPNTALNFVLFGAARWGLQQQRYSLAQGLGLGMFYVALVGFLGYLYNVRLLYGLGSVSAMALHTSLTFLLLALALLLRYPQQGIVGMITADHAGGMLVRRLVLAVGLVPILLCGLVLMGERQGLYSGDFAVVLFCVATVLLLSLVTWWSGLMLGQTDYYASFDALTKLPNRRRFEQQLSRWMRYCRRHQTLLCILFLDIDRFKNVNNVLGHDLGDELLVSLGQRLQAVTPAGGVLARWGGDEFILLMPNIASIEAGAKLAEQVLATLLLPFEVRSHRLTISASLGLALFPEDGEDRRALLQKADLALYEAKRLGRNSYQVYNQVFSEQVTASLQIENALIQGLDCQEFRLYYQPKLSLKTGQITGFEALLRWQSPTLGWMAPGQFIAIAEETGLIVALGEWVLQEACRQGQNWYQQGLLTVPISVNVSALQFHQADLVERLEQILVDSALPPDLLDVEITETTAMSDVTFMQARLHQLRDLGISLSLDDFGTGFSSLAYLSLFPLQTLKIDRSFISQILTSSTSQVITRSVIELGHSLGMEVLAEGPETQPQIDYLRAVDCDQIQGFGFQCPLPADQTTAFLRQRSEAGESRGD